MWSICKKELRQFFSSLTGYIAIIVFLLLSGLMLFVFPDSSIFSFGYATLTPFFELAPLVLLVLIPAITMRSFADEFRAGTFELLGTRPLSRRQIVLGKYLGCFIVVLIALLPTLLYMVSIQKLSAGEGMDLGATAGSYLGLLLLSAAFTAAGVCSSSFTSNQVVAFIVSACACLILYYGFRSVSRLPVLPNAAGYYIEMLGIDYHYRSMSRGVIDSRDLVYFFTVIGVLLVVTGKNLGRR
jgi:ABC-2 type transport system permease protein